MQSFLPIAQVTVAIFIILAILFQQRGTALGSAFGGGDSGGFYASRRGMQQKLYWATIVLVIVFILLALANLIF